MFFFTLISSKEAEITHCRCVLTICFCVLFSFQLNDWRKLRLDAAFGVSAALQWVTECLSFSHNLWKSFTAETAYIAEPIYYLSECHLDVLILIFCRSESFPKRLPDSRQSFCINASVLFFFPFFSCGKKPQCLDFWKFWLSALPDKFGEIKIFPAQWINTYYKQPSGSLKMC